MDSKVVDPHIVSNYLNSIRLDKRNRENLNRSYSVTELMLANAIDGIRFDDATRAMGVICNLIRGVEIALGADCRPTESELRQPRTFEKMANADLLWARLLMLWQVVYTFDPQMYRGLRDI